MPAVSRETIAQVIQHGPVEERLEEIDGYTIQFITFNQDVDGTPFLKGLPDDSCACPHWGYVLKGTLTFRFPDHDEVFEPGQAFYLPPGHIPLASKGSEYVSFSPSEELRTTSAAMMRNMQAMMGTPA